MKTTFLWLIVIFIQISVNGQTVYECNVPYSPPNSASTNLRSSSSVNCDFFDLTNEEYNQIPIIYIPVVFHFVPDNTGDNFICNPSVWSPLDAEWMVNELIDAANEDVFDGPSQDGQGGNTVPDTRIRLFLANVQTNTQCAGIWIYDTTRTRNDILNSTANPNVIDIICYDDDNEGSLIIGGATAGPNANWLENRNLLHYVQSGGSVSQWLHGRNIAHEIAHILNLPHAFSCFNDCYDLDEIAYCQSNPYGDCDPSWGGSTTDAFGNPICTWGIGNNLMSYNGDQTALTQCQWETMMNHLWTNPPNYIDWCTDVQADLNITTNTLWDGPKIMNRNVIVKSGATLTIECCELRMGGGMFIRVEKGGRLIIDGATITNHCDTRWAGIEIEGDPNLTQTTSNQGSLRILNESLIENATTAIITGTNGWTTQGGAIIEVDHSTFLNNRRNAAFLPYTLADNVSYFDSCTFELNADYWDTDYIDMVTMWNVFGLEFTDCSFINSNASISNQEHGIYTIDAGFNVSNNCSFEGFEGGIYSTNSNSLNSFTIDGASFDHNAVGVYAGSVDNIEVVNNSFSVGNYHTSTFDHGLFLITSTGFHVENNTFNQMGASTTPIGIECHHTGDDYNSIYRNTFDGLHSSNYAYGDNRDRTVLKSTGLEYLCNQNTNNTFDIRVVPDFVQPSNYSGIKYQQGTFSESAGNTFSLNTSPSGSDFGNFVLHEVRYNYDTGSNREPLNTSNVTNVLISNANTCQSQLGAAMTAQLRGKNLEQEMHSYRNTYLELKRDYNSRLDNGNSSGLIFTIESASETDKDLIFSQLQRISPWVSPDVFKVILEQEPSILSTQALLTLLLRNPDALMDFQLLSKVESTLSTNDYQTLLEQFQKRNTARTQLSDRASNYYNKMHMAINQLIREESLDKNPELHKVREWLAYKESLNAEYAIVESWLHEDNPEAALQHLQKIQNNWSFDEKQQLEFDQYWHLSQLKIKALQDGRSLADFTEKEVDILINVAATELGQASTQAKGILDFFYQTKVKTNNEISNLGVNAEQPPSYSLAVPPSAIELSLPPTIKVSPNPTNGILIFDFSTIEYQNNLPASIQILDQNGKRIKSISIRHRPVFDCSLIVNFAPCPIQ